MTTLEIAKIIFSQPTSPFHEFRVLETIESLLKKYKIPFFYDSSKNLIAGAKSKKNILPNSFAFVAHTDHPGFNFEIKNSSNKALAKWLGGGPLTQMLGAKVKCFSDKEAFSGVITQFESGNHREGIEFEMTFKKPIPKGAYFGTFDFPGFKLKNDNIITRAADDLAGCAMALGALIDLKQKKNIIAIFTRAEEVGFVGCWDLLKNNILPKTTKVISLEASRTLPGALLGEGPVVRLGDASTLFDSEFSLFITKTAQSLKQKNPDFKFQKRIMDGGSCEATAFSLFKYTTMGLAVPLKNYHNMGKNGPAPEIIHSQDMENGRKLLTEIGLNSKKFNEASSDLKKRLYKNFVSLKKNLK